MGVAEMNAVDAHRRDLRHGPAGEGDGTGRDETDN
jgi:hypothetical protein